jgi:amino acid adenylation domain-containing protein
VTDLDKRLAALSPEQRKILLRRLNRDTAAADSGVETIQPKGRETNVFPLSFSQQRLWILDQLEPGNAAYNIPIAIRMQGNLQIAALEKSLAEIVRRHEPLRTAFIAIDGKPMQVIHPPEEIILPVVDLSVLPKSEQEAKAAQWMSEEAMRPFDLKQAPLLRTMLLKLSETETIFLITVHHIISDAWSMVVFVRELEALYEAFCKEHPSPLPALSIQYADFAQWQLQWVENGNIKTQLEYWKTKLSAPIPTLELATDYVRPPVQTFNGAKHSVTLTQSLTASLKELGRQENATLFMVLLAAFKTLLYRYTGQTDVIVGSPIAGRNHPKLEYLIGVFINTLVLRTDLNDDPSFQEMIRRVREVALEAFANQDVPFEKLLEEIHPQRDLSRTPLFQVFFNMLNVGEDEVKFYGLKSEVISGADAESKFDLTLYVREHTGTLELILVYNRDLFEPARMEEMLHQFEYLLTQITANPSRNISEYSLVTERAREILPDPTEPLALNSEELTQYMFMKQAERVPNNIALVDKFDSWTYQELDLRTSQLAHYLQANDVGPRDIVAVYAHRSASLIVALLAIWKAGGAFLILDPAHPAQRQIDYLRTAQPKGWIQLQAAGMPSEELRQFVEDSKYSFRLELPASKTEYDGLLNNYLQHSPKLTVRADDLAYIAFTSGSTGQPKGIVGIHGPLSHFFLWHAERFGLQETDRFSMLSGLAHDPLLRDIFTPLTVGAMLCIPEQEEMLSSADLFSWMRRQHINVSHLTPAMEQILVGANSKNRQDSLDELRYAFFAGETLTWGHVSTLRAVAPRVTCVNFYGATETPQAMGYTVVDLETYPKNNAATKHPQRIPLGQGIDDVQLLVFNAAGQRAGIGEMGEICIRTHYLSKGYLHDEELTEQRFAINAFTRNASDRMYKTGDLGRYRPNGDIEFIGRNDTQVKIRGFRVELSEIEAALNKHPMVKQSLMSVWEAGEGDKRITAYVIPHEPGFTNSTDLRDHLKQHLPSYMVPSNFIFLDVFPVTPNGKIDYHALPAPDMTRHGDREELVAARNTTEEKLLNIWEELLNKHPIGVNDSFFELGGHSLIAVHMFTRINREFGVNLPLATLFQESTVEHLANVIQRTKTGRKTWSSLIAIETQGDHSPFFCVHGLTGDILWFRELAQCLAPDYPFYGLQSHGLDGIQNPLARIEEMASSYVEEIRQLQPKGPYYLGGASFGGTVALEMAQQLLAQGEQVSLLAIFDHSPPNIKLDNDNGFLKRRMTIAFRIVKNFPHWFREFVKLGPSRMLSRINRILRLIQKVKGQKGIDRVGQFDAEDLIDFAPELSAHRQQLITCNYQALKSYIPQPYAGQVTLFRALNRPLLNTYDPETGWQKLAPGRVDIYDIPSSHEGMFKKPQVAYLAEKLRACLEQVQNIKTISQ